jgi:hypothetical protein
VRFGGLIAPDRGGQGPFDAIAGVPDRHEGPRRADVDDRAVAGDRRTEDGDPGRGSTLTVADLEDQAGGAESAGDITL